MNKISKVFVVAVGLFLGACSSVKVVDNPDFEQWLKQVKVEAISQGISKSTVQKAFEKVSFKERLISLDRNQPEVKKTMAVYLEQVVNPVRITQGQKFYLENRKKLKQVSEEYSVPEEFIVALLGLETNYGERFGNDYVIGALATLAYDKRRSEFFKKELFNALKILDDGHISIDNMKGSWAGAMGQNQFMPSSFIHYAVDYNKDGKKDIWKSKDDVFASTANYLKRAGFDKNQKWGRAVTLPENFDKELLGLGTKKTVQEWEVLGVRNKNGLELPTSNMQGSIIAPDGLEEQAYLIYNNFRVFMKWNRSYHFATSVGLLSDRIREVK
ncbi:MAG: lytic murein transglycosylase [Alphaproteobacteria bacterium]|nr:lytic murein transglycosylase [Alphaproteobacteria bacterium]